MITLASTTDKVQLTTTIATATLEVLVEFTQATTAAGALVDGSFAPLAMQRTTFSGAATADILTAPASATLVRKATLITVRNTHATIAQTVLIEVLVAGSATDFGGTVTLQAGEWLYITEAGVWFIHDINGGVKTSSATGRLIKTTVLSSGTSFLTQMATTSLKVSMVGGGGGGGGCTSVAAAAIGAGGGGAGGYAEKTFIVTPNTAYAYTIGAAGTGASGAAGNNGGNSTWVGSVTVTAFGGTGGPVAAPATTLKAAAGGAGGVVSTNGDVNAGGEPGAYGVVLIIATPILASGAGGASVLGGGGLGIIAVGNGNNATGFGAGGGGSATGASAVRTGGNGTGGCIIVSEYA